MEEPDVRVREKTAAGPDGLRCNHAGSSVVVPQPLNTLRPVCFDRVMVETHSHWQMAQWARQVGAWQEKWRGAFDGREPALSTLRGIDWLLNVRHFDQKVIVLCVRWSLRYLGAGRGARHGANEARYAAIDVMSSTVRFVTTSFMGCAAAPARAPLWMS